MTFRRDGSSSTTRTLNCRWDIVAAPTTLVLGIGHKECIKAPTVICTWVPSSKSYTGKLVNYSPNFAPPVRSKIPLLARLGGSLGAIALSTWGAFHFGLNVPTVGFLYLVLVVLV